MKEFKMKPGLGLFVILALIFAIGVTTSIAQQKTKVAGKLIGAVTKEETINIGDTEGHVIGLSEFEGNNVSTGKQKFMDGAQVVHRGYSDLVTGNGSHQGYSQYNLADAVVFSRYGGKITTTLSSTGSLYFLHDLIS